MSGPGEPLDTVEGDVTVERVSSGNEAVSAVTDAVMSITGADEPPEVPLNERVDSDVLESVIDGTDDGNVRVGFEYAGCEIVVRGDGVVTAVRDEGNCPRDAANGDIAFPEPAERTDGE